jgi:hypothetical protein
MTSRRLFWLALALGLANYLAMVLWSLPRISQAAGGAVPFDLRPLGYDLDEAQAFLGCITPEGRSFYLHTQHWLDTFYPPLLALTLASGLLWLAPRAWGRWRWLLALLPLPGMLFDWLENARVALLLQASDVGPGMIAAASRATVLKSAFTTLAMAAFVGVLLLAAWRRWRPPVG